MVWLFFFFAPKKNHRIVKCGTGGPCQLNKAGNHKAAGTASSVETLAGAEPLFAPRSAGASAKLKMQKKKKQKKNAEPAQAVAV